MAVHADVVLDDELGPVLLLDAESLPAPVKVPMTCPELRLLATRSRGLASALEGTPPGPEHVEHVEHPFARYWPSRSAIEVGIPDELVYDTVLSPRARFLWIVIWRECPMAPRIPKRRMRISVLARQMKMAANTVRSHVDALEERGWMEVCREPPVPAANGEWEFTLFLTRRPYVRRTRVIRARERYDAKQTLGRHHYAPSLGPLRELFGATKAEEAGLSGVPWRTWHRWEAQEHRMSVAKMRKVAERWGVDLFDLMVEHDYEQLEQVKLERKMRLAVAEMGAERVHEALTNVGGSRRW